MADEGKESLINLPAAGVCGGLLGSPKLLDRTLSYMEIKVKG